MEKTTQVELEGLTLEIPLKWDELSEMYLPDYASVWENALYTPEGYRVMITIEDACPHADLQPGIYKDCGSCNFFRQKLNSQLGVCHCEAMRRKATLEEEEARV